MSEIVKQSIRFPNNHSALAVLPTAETTMEEIMQTLDLPVSKAIILIIGGADNLDENLLPRLTQLFGRGIAKAAIEAKAAIIDGGTQAGVMSLMGEGVAARGYQSSLIGVAPVGKVSYPGSSTTEGTSLEPNHSHFVLVEGTTWGNETSMLFSLLGKLTTKTPDMVTQGFKSNGTSKKEPPGKIPSIAILAGGGDVAKTEVLRAVRQNITLIVVEGSGGLADDIAAAYKEKDAPIDDPVMAEIISDGELHFHLLTNSVKGIERLIVRELGSDKVLMQAWETFASYDQNANFQQRRFDRLQQSIIMLGVVGVALVIIQQVFAPRETNGDLKTATIRLVGYGWWSVYHLLIIIPILLTILVTAANRFKQGNKWLLLRAGAEAIKREIYRYRSRALQYATNGEQQLSKAVEQITRRTMQTEVNLAALLPYDKDKGFPPYMDAAKGGDDGFSCLTPDRYVEVRLGDQLNYFQRKTLGLEKQLRILYWLTFIIGGAGTYLAAIGMQAWVALTTSIVAAFGTYLGYRQTESTLTKYNQAATDLANVKAWWEALSSEEQAQQANIDSLVDHTEQVLQSEMDGWIQQMQNALADLRKAQEPVNDPEANNKSITSVQQQTVQVVTVQQTSVQQEKTQSEKDDKDATNGNEGDNEIMPAEPTGENDNQAATSGNEGDNEIMPIVPTGENDNQVATNGNEGDNEIKPSEPTSENVTKLTEKSDGVIKPVGQFE
ncbi:MAG: DUF4231 domain-containing protein [Bacteroidota bacterium]|nr:DUF4231 domain-containing protein [Bacteroidota bacterium]